MPTDGAEIPLDSDDVAAVHEAPVRTQLSRRPLRARGLLGRRHDAHQELELVLRSAAHPLAVGDERGKCERALALGCYVAQDVAEVVVFDEHLRSAQEIDATCDIFLGNEISVVVVDLVAAFPSSKIGPWA